MIQVISPKMNPIPPVAAEGILSARLIKIDVSAPVSNAGDLVSGFTLQASHDFPGMNLFEPA